MGDPKRWLEKEGGATELERELLRRAPNLDPPTHKSAEVWAALAARLPPIGPSGGGEGGAGASGVEAGGGALALATKTGGTFVALKLGVATVAVGGSLALLYSSVGPERPAATLAPASTAAPVVSQTSSTTAEPVPTPLAPETQTENPRSPPRVDRASRPTPSRARVAPATPDSAQQASLLREESQLVERARAALRGGDPSQALLLLETARTRFPNGVLEQERQALTIEALANTGHEADAGRRAAVFLKTYPGSPHADHVRTFLR